MVLTRVVLVINCKLVFFFYIFTVHNSVYKCLICENRYREIKQYCFFFNLVFNDEHNGYTLIIVKQLYEVQG